MLPITVSPSPLPCSVLFTATVSWAFSRLTLRGTKRQQVSLQGVVQVSVADSLLWKMLAIDSWLRCKRRKSKKPCPIILERGIYWRGCRGRKKSYLSSHQLRPAHNQHLCNLWWYPEGGLKRPSYVHATTQWQQQTFINVWLIRPF